MTTKQLINNVSDTALTILTLKNFVVTKEMKLPITNTVQNTLNGQLFFGL